MSAISRAVAHILEQHHSTFPRTIEVSPDGSEFAPGDVVVINAAAGPVAGCWSFYELEGRQRLAVAPDALAPVAGTHIGRVVGWVRAAEPEECDALHRPSGFPATAISDAFPALRRT